MTGARSLQLGDGKCADPRDVADRQVDLAEQEDEDDAVGQHRRSGHLDDDVSEVLGREEVRRLEAEEDDDEDEREDDREDAEIARADVRRRAVKQPEQPCGLFLFRSRALVLADDLDVRGRHTGAVAVAGIPETFVGTPAVIAWTTSCCVVLSRWNTPTFLPRRSTVIRCAVSKTSWRLCEMMTTERPCSASRRTSASTCSVCATPRAAVGSSRMTSFEFHITARATATDCL